MLTPGFLFAGGLQYFSDADARVTADQLMQNLKQKSPDWVSRLGRAAFIGHPAAMAMQCSISGDKLAPPSLRPEGVAWCRLMMSELPEGEKQARAFAAKKLAEVAEELPIMEEAAARAEKRIRSRMTEPWQEAEASANADAPPALDSVALSSPGFETPQAALDAYVTAMENEDGDALEAAINPLDVVRLKRTPGRYEEHIKMLRTCKITVLGSISPVPTFLLAINRYKEYPLQSVPVKLSCRSGLVMGVALSIVQLKGRWYINTTR